MKLYVLLSLVFIQATSAAQTVTLNVKEASFFEVLTAIRKQTGIYFTFSETTVIAARPVTINLKSVSLTHALDKCMENQPLEYRFVDSKTILITAKQKTEKKLEQALEEPAYADLIGTVTTDKGESLPSATIRVQRGKEFIAATITDATGKFILKGLQQGDVLFISYTGYSNITITYNGQKEIKAILTEARKEINQVTIIGYGTVTERFNTGNIATIKAVDIQKQPVPNVLQALQGKVPGLVITQTNGNGSAPFKVELRGRSTIDKSLPPAEPLYIVDGVPLTVLNLTNIGNGDGASPGFAQNELTGPAGGQSPLYSINPSDIESVTVLKDGDATAIYGNRGANGVIIINTKRGAPGKTKLEVTGSYGIRFVKNYYDLYNTQQYLELRREAYKNDGVEPTLLDGYDLLEWDTARYTNWQKVFWGGKAKNMDIQMSLSGGDKRTTFRLGAGFQRATSLNDFSGKDQRGSFQFNITHKGLNEKFLASLTTMYSYAQNDLISLGQGAMVAPNAPAIFNSNGSLNFDEWRNYPGGNPFTYLLNPFVVKTAFLNSQLRLEYRLAKGLSFTSNFGFSNNTGRQKLQYPIASQDPLTNPTGKLLIGTTIGNRVIIEPQLQYLKSFENSDISVIAGGSYQVVSQDGTSTYGDGYTNDYFLASIRNAKTVTANDAIGEYKYAGAFARLNYNYGRKYVLNISARRDGSSKFGTGNQFGNFGAAGLAWLISEEPFFEPLSKIISFAKFRMSYGYTGSDIVSDYKYLSRWSFSGRSYLNSITYAPTQLANPNLKWQVDKKMEAGLSIGLLDDRHTINVSFYRNRIGNQLLIYKLPTITGFSEISANSPATVQNMGWEVTTVHRVIKNKNRGLELDLNFNIGINRNKLLSFPGLETSPYAGDYFIGKSLSLTRSLKYEGVDPATGLYKFEDVNKDGIIDYNPGSSTTDMLTLTDLAVKFDGGFGGEARYKGISLSFSFGFRKLTGKSALFASPYLGFPDNQPVKANDRWRNPGDVSFYAKPSAITYREDFAFISNSDAQYRDASFIRLNNLSIDYLLPNRLSSLIGVERLSLFARGQNLFVISNYDGIDPEVPGIGTLPPLTTVMLGINLGL